MYGKPQPPQVAMQKRKQEKINSVSIILGSKSDIGVYKTIAATLERLGLLFEKRIMSAHRTPEELKTYIEHSSTKVFIAVAGLSAALPGAIASMTIKPVIGVPMRAESSILGLDSVLSILQMPRGTPVATVGLSNGVNAALLAAEILAIENGRLSAKLEDFRKAQKEKVLLDNTKFQKLK